LLQTLEEMVASGSVFKHGQAVEICGGTCKIHGRENGDMELRQPDMTIIPIQWIPGMDQPVRMAVLQMHVCRLLGSPLEYVRLDQAVQISAAALAGATSFTMSRETPNGRVAGWTITAAEDDTSALQLMSVFEAIAMLPKIVAFLALSPPATARMHTDGRLEAMHGDKTADSDTDEFLHRIASVVWEPVKIHFSRPAGTGTGGEAEAQRPKWWTTGIVKLRKLLS